MPLPHPNRGELWWVALDPVVGRELGGHVPDEPRPALIVSTDALPAETAGKVIIVPGTSREHPGLPRVAFSWRLGGRSGRTFLCCDDVRAVSVERLRGPLAPSRGAAPIPAPAAAMASVEQTLRLLLGL